VSAFNAARFAAQGTAFHLLGAPRIHRFTHNCCFPQEIKTSSERVNAGHIWLEIGFSLDSLRPSSVARRMAKDGFYRLPALRSCKPGLSARFRCRSDRPSHGGVSAHDRDRSHRVREEWELCRRDARSGHATMPFHSQSPIAGGWIVHSRPPMLAMSVNRRGAARLKPCIPIVEVVPNVLSSVAFDRLIAGFYEILQPR